MGMKEALKLISRSKLMVAGFTMLVLAMLLSALAVFYTTTPTYSSGGSLGRGVHVIGNGSFEDRYPYYNRTLTLSANNATVQVSWTGFNRTYSIRGNVTVYPSDRPEVNVINGTVTYTYRVKAISHPYSDLAIPASILAVAGTITFWVAYVHAFRGKRK
ncbi:hypothetical protein [Thermococcus prieurii]